MDEKLMDLLDMALAERFTVKNTYRSNGESLILMPSQVGVGGGDWEAVV